MRCAVHTMHHLLGKRWSLRLIDELYFSGEMSFGSMKKRTKGITSKLLSKRLSELLKQGIIKKSSARDNNHNMYTLTKKGNDLHFVIDKMKEWGIAYQAVPVSCTQSNCNSCTKEMAAAGAF